MGKTTTDMQLVPIGKLVPYANNARTHSPEQITKLRSSLREFGFINPVIIDRDYGIIAGHGRVMAAKAEGITDVPCVFVDHLTEAQKKAYILADNRYAMDAGWDEEMLRVEIEALQGMDFNIDLSDKDGYDFLLKTYRCLHDAMAKDASIYSFYATAKTRLVFDAFEDAGFKVGAGLVWKKDRLVLARTEWKYIHEPIVWGWRKDGKHKWYGDQKQTSAFEFDRIKNSKKDDFS